MRVMKRNAGNRTTFVDMGAFEDTVLISHHINDDDFTLTLRSANNQPLRPLMIRVELSRDEATGLCARLKTMLEGK